MFRRGIERFTQPEGSRVFENRSDAGRQLAQGLMQYKDEHPIVLALPRGGVPVAHEVAKALGAPLDVFVVRKLGAPMQPELGIGAIAPGGVLALDSETISMLGITQDDIRRIVEEETIELDRRTKHYRDDRPMPNLRDRTVILIDDGLATGVTAFAAIQALRQMGPRKIVLAVPVCAAQTTATLRNEVTDLVCLKPSSNFGAVGLWYRNFEQTTDEEVVQFLQEANQQPDHSPQHPTPNT